MEIPKQLIGQEVKSFIGLVREWLLDSKSVLGKITIDDFYGLCYGVEDFYSSKFNPSDIPLLFEGWRFDGRKYYSSNVGYVEINTIHEGKEVMLYVKEGEGYCVVKPPKTLNDFITNAIQAGIKLVWRQQND